MAVLPISVKRHTAKGGLYGTDRRFRKERQTTPPPSSGFVLMSNPHFIRAARADPVRVRDATNSDISSDHLALQIVKNGTANEGCAGKFGTHRYCLPLGRWLGSGVAK